MGTEDLERFHARLKALKLHLEDEGQVGIEPNCSDASGRRDDDFQPLNEMYQAIASGRNRNRGIVLKQVREALELIRCYPEEYGLCQECEEPIPQGRLELMPYAPLCVRCQSEQEDPVGGYSRKNLTDYR